MQIDLFDEKKLTQAAVFFLLQSPNQHINILKLMKLLYLAERKSFETYHTPIIGDLLGSMKNGPVLSRTLNCINEGSRNESYWDKHLSDRKDHQVALRDGCDLQNIDDLLELSDNDINILKQVWFQFHDKSQWELVDYTHEHCPEWRHTLSFIPISYQELFTALGFSENLSNQIIEELEEQSSLKKALELIQ